jgi:hypothetical protein
MEEPTVSTTYLVYCLSLGEESLNEKVDWRGDISVSAPRRGRESDEVASRDVGM